MFGAAPPSTVLLARAHYTIALCNMYMLCTLRLQILVGTNFRKLKSLNILPRLHSCRNTENSTMPNPFSSQIRIQP